MNDCVHLRLPVCRARLTLRAKQQLYIAKIKVSYIAWERVSRRYPFSSRLSATQHTDEPESSLGSVSQHTLHSCKEGASTQKPTSGAVRSITVHAMYSNGAYQLPPRNQVYHTSGTTRGWLLKYLIVDLRSCQGSCQLLGLISCLLFSKLKRLGTLLAVTQLSLDSFKLSL